MLLVRADARVALAAPSLYLGAGLAFFVGSTLVARTMHGPGAAILPLLPLAAFGVALSFVRVLRWNERELRIYALGRTSSLPLGSLRFAVVMQKNTRGGWLYLLVAASAGARPERVSLHVTEAGVMRALERLAMSIHGLSASRARAEAVSAMAAKTRV